MPRKVKSTKNKIRYLIQTNMRCQIATPLRKHPVDNALLQFRLRYSGIRRDPLPRTRQCLRGSQMRPLVHIRDKRTRGGRCHQRRGRRSRTGIPSDVDRREQQLTLGSHLLQPHHARSCFLANAMASTGNTAPRCHHRGARGHHSRCHRCW